MKWSYLYIIYDTSGHVTYFWQVTLLRITMLKYMSGRQISSDTYENNIKY